MDKKWHIYKTSDYLDEVYPLCWDGRVLEFDTEIQAQRFLHDCTVNSARLADFYANAYLAKDKTYKNSLNASHKTV